MECSSAVALCFDWTTRIGSSSVFHKDQTKASSIFPDVALRYVIAPLDNAEEKLLGMKILY